MNSYVLDGDGIRKFVAAPQFDVETVTRHDADFPKITVVIPSFQQSQFFERSLLSVLNQNYPNLELIVIDGGSTDGTVEIIKKYEPFIGYWVSEQDRGQCHALNKGFANASGQIFGWLNADDLYLPQAFCQVVRAFSLNPGKRIVFGDYLTIDAEDRLLTREYAFDFSLRHLQFEGFHLNAQALFWRNEVHQNFSGFDERLHNTMDYEMMLAFGINEGKRRFLRIPVPLACFRRQPAQKTQDGRSQRVDNEHRLMASKHGYELKYTPWGRTIRWFYRCRRAYWYVRRGGFRYAAAKYLQRFSSAQPANAESGGTSSGRRGMKETQRSEVDRRRAIATE